MTQSGITQRAWDAMFYGRMVQWSKDNVDRGVAWHYTTAKSIKGIMSAGALTSSGAYEKVIWFSLEQHWERQADATRFTDTSPETMLANGVIPYRFGMSTLKLCSFQKQASHAALESVRRYGLDAFILGKFIVGMWARQPGQDEQKRQLDGIARAHAKHYVYPEPALPLSEIDRIEVFGELGWTDCKQSLKIA